MKVKKSKHVHHYRDGYTPVVRCHLSRRHKVAGGIRFRPDKHLLALPM